MTSIGDFRRFSIFRLVSSGHRAFPFGSLCRAELSRKIIKKKQIVLYLAGYLEAPLLLLSVCIGREQYHALIPSSVYSWTGATLGLASSEDILMWLLHFYRKGLILEYTMMSGLDFTVSCAAF